MLYIASFLDDVALVKLQSCYVLFVRGNSYRKISAEDLRARNLLLRIYDDISMIHRTESNYYATFWYVPWKMSVSLPCVLSSICPVSPRRRRRWFQNDAEKYVDSSLAMWNLPSLRLPRLFTPSLLLATPLSSVGSRSVRISLPSHSRARNLVGAPI